MNVAISSGEKLTNNEDDKKCLSTIDNSFIQSIKNLSQGTWLSELNRIRLDKVRGKFIHHMGYMSNYSGCEKSTKYDFLYPEESLYLAENSKLIVHFNMRENQLNVALTIQQCYEWFFKQKPTASDCKNDRAEYNIDLDCYKIYKSLIKNGFIVRRAEKCGQRNHHAPKEKDLSSSSPKKSTPIRIKPLVERSDHERLSQLEIYSRLNRVIPNVTLDELRDRFGDVVYSTRNDRPTHLFEVNQPDKRFQKSKPPKADFTIFAAKQNTNGNLQVPGLADFIANSTVAKMQIYAFTDDSNQPIYYSFDFNFSIPPIVQE